MLEIWRRHWVVAIAPFAYVTDRYKNKKSRIEKNLLFQKMFIKTKAAASVSSDNKPRINCVHTRGFQTFTEKYFKFYIYFLFRILSSLTTRKKLVNWHQSKDQDILFVVKWNASDLILVMHKSLFLTFVQRISI